MSKETCNKKEKCCKCNHKHNHKNEEENEKNKKLSKILYLISILLFIISFIPIFENYKVYLYLLTVILAGYELILEGIKNIFHFNFEEDTLMTIAVISAFVLGELPESAMVVLLFRLGEFLEEKAVENSNKNIEDIVKIKAKTANLLNENGKIEIIDVEKLNIGDKILIKPGEMVPVDCNILEGTSNISAANITGESREVFVDKDKELLSGSINLTGSLKCIVKRNFENSTASQIVDLVYEATNNKGQTEKFITKFSKIYTPIVIILAILIAIIPPLFFMQEWKDWILRALVFLVASCPCSIVISIPLAFFSSVGAISKKGMLVKGTKHIEDLAKAKQIAFDKTGTITTGKMEVDEIISVGNLSEEEILTYIYSLEKNSNHPISTAIEKEVDKRYIKQTKNADNFEEIAGYGIKAIIDGKNVLFGNKKLLKNENIDISKIEKEGNLFAIEGNLEACITLKEEIREDAKEIVKNFSKVNIKDIIMLTGDSSENAKKIAKEVGIEKVYSSLLPQEKLEKIKEYKKKGNIIFVGDGINDGPVLAESSFGISMGEGTEIASNISDGILISNRISIIPSTIKIARKTMNIVKFNIVFSLFIKLIVLTLGILAVAPIWLAIVADTGVSLLTVLNSMRIFKTKS